MVKNKEKKIIEQDAIVAIVIGVFLSLFVICYTTYVAETTASVNSYCVKYNLTETCSANFWDGTHGGGSDVFCTNAPPSPTCRFDTNYTYYEIHHSTPWFP